MRRQLAQRDNRNNAHGCREHCYGQHARLFADDDRRKSNDNHSTNSDANAKADSDTADADAQTDTDADTQTNTQADADAQADTDTAADENGVHYRHQRRFLRV